MLTERKTDTEGERRKREGEERGEERGVEEEKYIPRGAVRVGKT